MAEGDASTWPREELGDDPKAWEWALANVSMHKVIPLATYGEEGPRVRPVTTVPHKGRIYVLTGTLDAKVQDLGGEPRFEFYVLVKEGERTGYVRFRGTARTQDDADLKREVGQASGFMDDYWDGPGDPNYTLLWLDVTAAEIMRPGTKGYELLSR